MNRPRRQFIAPKRFFALLAVGFWFSAQGATITWTNTAGGSWSVTNNWSPNQIPGAADTALITASGSYTVTLNNNAQVSTLLVGGAGGTPTLTVAGGTLSSTNGTIAVGGILNVEQLDAGRADDGQRDNKHHQQHS